MKTPLKKLSDVVAIVAVILILIVVHILTKSRTLQMIQENIEIGFFLQRTQFSL